MPRGEQALRAGRTATSASAPLAVPSSVQVRRSSRRRRTVTAFREDGGVVVCIPARFTADEESRWVRAMLARLDAQERRRHVDDEALASRAARLSERYLDGRALPASVRWVDNQHSRWGSTTPEDGTVRISSELQRLPSWVLDYVVLHELAHLLVAGHGDPFWRLLEPYPRTERARGFLQGYAEACDREEPEGS